MGTWPVLQHSRVKQDDSVIPTYLLTLPDPGGVNTKGAYATVVAVVPFDVEWLIVELRGSTVSFYYVDIAIGTAGNEVVIVPNFFATGQSSGSGNFLRTYQIPVAVRRGERISMRFQHQNTAGLSVKMQMIAAGFASVQSPQRWFNWGADLATTSGTTITANAAANTKGAYTQLVAATDESVRYLFVNLQTLEGPRNISIDVAVGAAASEVVIIPDISVTNEDNGWSIGPLPFSIPKNSRISMRIASDTGLSIIGAAVMGGA